jgi:hypothetical protein
VWAIGVVVGVLSGISVLGLRGILAVAEHAREIVPISIQTNNTCLIMGATITQA